MPDQSRRSLEHTLRFTVRSYELDQNGHVNNATYVAWAENVTNEHAEAIGFGRAWSLERGGGWVVRRHEATYHVPAVALDEIEATVRVEGVRGVRGWRRTWIRRATDGALLAEVFSEWAWVRTADGRPARVPDEIVAAFGVGQAGEEPSRDVPA
ncbi:MAG TPA: thioesterase family protein [Candidatus Limnocylindria bacterium]|nr:thioesterase family protein [Candidatus Limnocylindria bacterium]